MDIPSGGLIGRIYHSFQRLSSLRIPIFAANASFFLVLAVFPTLLLLLGLLRYTGLPVSYLTGLLEGVLPEALLPGARRLILSTYYNSSGALVSLSAGTALWSASRGLYGLLTGLNALYNVPEDRGWFYTRAISVFYTFGFLLVMLLTLVLHVFGTTLLRALSNTPGAFFRILCQVVDLRSVLLLAIQTLFFTLLFMVLPNRKNPFSESLPGALFASCGWLIFTNLYSIYVNHFSGLSNIYGSVYALALSMLWLYCCMSILFYGGAINSYLAQKK